MKANVNQMILFIFTSFGIKRRLLLYYSLMENVLVNKCVKIFVDSFKQCTVVCIDYETDICIDLKYYNLVYPISIV